MSFDLRPTDEQEALRSTLRDLAQNVLRPSARAAETARQTHDDIARRVHEIGVTAPVDEAYGGGGTFDAVTYCMAVEELAWGDPGIAYQLFGAGLAAVVIGMGGNDEQRQRWLPSFVDADPPAAFLAVGEKLAVGDIDALDTSIEGDKVVGRKYGVLNAPDARLGVVVGRTIDGPAAVVVDGGGYEVVRPEDKMGLEAAPTWVIDLDTSGEAIPASDELLQALMWSKLMIGAVAVGTARASLEHASAYAQEREAFGRPIGAFQAISFKIADMAIDVDAARLAVWKAAWKVDRGDAGFADVAEAVGHALAAAVRCGDDAVQILGGHGYIKDHPVEKWFRDAVTLSVFDAPDVLGDVVVARSVLG